MRKAARKPCEKASFCLRVETLEQMRALSTALNITYAAVISQALAKMYYAESIARKEAKNVADHAGLPPQD